MAGIPNPLPKLMMKIQGIKYGKNIKFFGIPVIIKSKDSSIEIGDNLIVNSSFLSNLVGLYSRSIIIARNGGKIEIGSNVGISGTTIYCREKITIGSNTMIGGNTKIVDNDFHPSDPEARAKNPNKNMGIKPVKIGSNVFIGCNCLILKGAEIGSNSTIGAGSVVCGKIPDNCIAAGNPAKIVKYFN